MMDALDTTLLLSSTITALTFIVIYNQIKTFTYWSSHGVKGPTPFPFVGTNIYLFFKNRVQLDEEWKNKYGRTYGVYEGSLPVLRTSDNEVIKFVCIKNFSSFTDRNTNFVNGDEMKGWLFFSKGNDWSTKRALITPMFTGNKLKNMFPSLITSSKKFFKEVEVRQTQAAKRLAGSDSSFEIMDDVGKAKALLKASTEYTSFSKDESMSLTLDTIAKCFFSLNLDTYKDKSSDFYKRAFAFATFDVAYFIIWSFIPAFISRYFKLDPVPNSKAEFFNKLSANIVNERRSNKNQKVVHHDMIQYLMEARIPNEHQNVHTAEDDMEAHYNDKMSIDELDRIHKEQEKNSKSFKKFSDFEISSQASFFFLAGFETTSSSITFCLYEFGHHQDLQEEVYQELKAVLGADSTLVRDYSDLSNFKKLEAFISETLRIYNPVTENTRRVTAPEGVSLPTNPPVRLEQGSIIAISGLVCHRDQDYWDEPMKFDMTRFYPENKHKIKSCTYHPFGIGPRNCAGMRFALLNIRLFLANCLLNYRVLPGPKNLKYPPEFKPHTFFLQLANTDFRLIPRNLESTSS